MGRWMDVWTEDIRKGWLDGWIGEGIHDEWMVGETSIHSKLPSSVNGDSSLLCTVPLP